MAYVVIVNVDENNRVSKYQPCKTEAEAQAHVDKVNELGYHNAFYVEDPGVDVRWVIPDVAAKTITVDRPGMAQYEIDRVEEAKEQQRKAEEYRASLQYEDRLVAFLDVLGWRAAVEKSRSDPELVKVLGLGLTALLGQANMIQWMQEHGGDAGWPGDPQINQFSDSIIISTKADENGKSHLIMSLGFVCSALLQKGFLIRGGIAAGQMLHRDGLAYGPALTYAYDLESKVATHPRIILQKELSEAWGEGDKLFHKDGTLLGHNKTWRKMPSDDWAFFDYLQDGRTCKA